MRPFTRCNFGSYKKLKEKTLNAMFLSMDQSQDTFEMATAIRIITRERINHEDIEHCIDDIVLHHIAPTIIHGVCL